MIIRSLFLFIILLTGLKILAIHYTAFNLFGDEAQYWLWAQTLDFGYYSKPPLLAWIIYFYTNFFGDGFLALKLLPILFYFFSSFAFYRLCRKLSMDRWLSYVATFTFLTIPAVTVSSFLISTDVVFLFFWILSLIMVLEIRESPSLISFVVFGLFLGLAFLSKYAAFYFLVCLFSYYLLDKKIRNILISNKLNLAFSLLAALLVVLPNIVWNFNNGWMTLIHTSDNANLANMDLDFFRGVVFLIVQILMIGPIIFLCSVIFFKKTSFDNNLLFLLTFSIPIIVIVFIEAILVRANANWAAPALVCLLIFLIKTLKKNVSFILAFNYFINVSFGVFLFSLIASSSNLTLFDRINGVSGFSNVIKGYLNNSSTIVVSDRLLFSSLAYEYKDDDIRVLMPYLPGSKITNHFQTSHPLTNEMLGNFLFIGNPIDISYLKNNYKLELLIKLDEKFISSSVEVYEASF